MITETSIKPDLEGEVFFPSPEAIEQTYVADWDAKATRAGMDLTGFWAERAHELEWYKPWDTVLDESKKPSINGSLVERSISSTTVLTGMLKPGGEINWHLSGKESLAISVRFHTMY